ncbi:MAG: hypothetical protein HRT35_17140 [Algicola sp.]|nr:hypothetical protein [Algicola sp.]
MKASLSHYMAALNKNPNLMARHNDDPLQTAQAFGLPDEEIQMIVKRDFNRIDRDRLDT